MPNVLFTNVRVLDASITILQDPRRLLAVPKDGWFHKEPELAGQGARRLSVA